MPVSTCAAPSNCSASAWPVDDSFSTLAGLVLQRLGRLPVAGESFTSEGWRFEVLAMDGARIGRLRVAPAEA